jgi:ABC-type Fe3+/spermidine/putrescine transport system ATPase subunit
VALARALICRPKVLLLDEPLGALDKKLREEMQLELRQLQQTVGITFVFVTHDQEEALTLSDRIAVMARGKTLQIDSATRLYEAPNCREVAEFIGTMNVFDGVLAELNGGTVSVDAGRLGRLVAKANGEPLAPGQPIALAVRPEKLRLEWSEPPQRGASLAGKVTAEAYFGDRSHYYVAVDGLAKPLAVANQNAERILDDSSAIGRSVWVSWPLDAAVLLTR